MSHTFFFLPSAFEALGTVLLDALAREIPVVATRVGGIPEIVRPGREGLLAATGETPARKDKALDLAPRPPHFGGQAKSVIWIYSGYLVAVQHVKF